MRRCRPFNELKPQQQRRRMLQAEAFSRFIVHGELPLQPVPKNETPQEQRVRVLSDLLERFRLLEQSGSEAKRTVDVGDSWLYWTTKDVEDMLIAAKRELRFSRGDF